jgi:hypothetical protein
MKYARMILRHAGALGVLGWYLMVPPAPSFPGASDPSIPLYHWKILGVFNSANACEGIKNSLLKPPELPEGADLSRDVLCLSKDDPRIKRK